MQAAEIIFVVADLSNVWLVADVPEQSSAALRIGKTVVAEVPAIPRPPIQGHLNFVSAIVNPETRTVRARMDLRNPEWRYKPAMLASMTLLEGAERRRAVPEAAVVREDNQDNVMVQVAPRTFRLTPVTLGMEFRGMRGLESGVAPDEKIVLDGAFHLNNERKRRFVQGD